MPHDSTSTWSGRSMPRRWRPARKRGSALTRRSHSAYSPGVIGARTPGTARQDRTDRVTDPAVTDTTAS